MKRYRLNEDKQPSKLPVRFSHKIFKDIKEIESLNQENTQSLILWTNYVNNAKDYVSNRVIAWDYTDKHIRFPNGTFFIRDFDYNVGYTIKTDEVSHYSYVYVFMLNLKPEEFGLKIPPTLKEDKGIKGSAEMTYYLKESQLIQMIIESANKILNTIQRNSHTDIR